MQHKLVLGEGVLNPSSTDVGSTVVNDSVGLPCLEMTSDDSACLVGGDVSLEGDCLGNGFDGSKIDTDNERLDGHRLSCDLQPRTGSGTQIDQTSRLLEEAELLVQLDQLEGSTRAVSFFFGEIIVFIQTAFAVL